MTVVSERTTDGCEHVPWFDETPCVLRSSSGDTGGQPVATLRTHDDALEQGWP